MAYLTEEDGITILTDDSGNFLTDDVPIDVTPSTFPLVLLMRLRLHAAWLLFMLLT